MAGGLVLFQEHSPSRGTIQFPTGAPNIRGVSVELLTTRFPHALPDLRSQARRSHVRAATLRTLHGPPPFLFSMTYEPHVCEVFEADSLHGVPAFATHVHVSALGHGPTTLPVGAGHSKGAEEARQGQQVCLDLAHKESLQP